LATAKEIFLKQEYSWAIQRLPDSPIVVDVGANIGLASRYFLHHRPRAKILAVEAMPDTFEVTQKNLGIPGIAGQCRVINAAIWSNDGEVSIRLPSTGAYSRAAVGAEGDIVVQASRLDTILKKEDVRRVDLLKVDIEGAEVEMFRSADDWLTKIIALAIEFHDGSRQACRFDEAMKRHGFQIMQASGHTVYAWRN
jgi:FkbM family methyltransferase